MTKHYGEDHPYTGVCYSNLCVAFEDAGRFSEAEFYGRQAWLIGVIHEGQDNSQAVTKTINMASILEAQGRHVEAADMHRIALEIGQRVYPQGGLPLCWALSEVATDQLRAGRHADAVRLQTAAVQVHDQLLGPDNRQTVNAQARLGYILERTGDREAAERIYRETLAWRIKNLDEADPSLAGGKASLARCLARRGELHEAVRLFDEAMRIREQVVARMIRI